MDNMISNAMQHFKKLTDLVTDFKIGSKNFYRTDFKPLEESTVSRLQTHTLQGVVDMVKEKIDHPDIINSIKPGAKESVPLHIHILNPTSVFLESGSFGPFLQRHTLIESDAYVTGFHFGHGYTPEEFIIALNTQFIQSETRDELITLCGAITKDSSGTVKDDGISQKMEVKSGIAMRDNVEIKNPFNLQPFRTFSEIKQPESSFVFRVKDDRGITCHLYEADGSAWKVEAIESIRAYFSEHLKDVPVIA